MGTSRENKDGSVTHWDEHGYAGKTAAPGSGISSPHETLPSGYTSPLSVENQQEGQNLEYDAMLASLAGHRPDPQTSLSTDIDKRVGQAASTDDQNMLARYARDPDWEVRDATVRNKNTSERTVMVLAHDKDWTIRRKAAQHPNVSLDALEVLCLDPNDEVAYAGITNPRATSLPKYVWVRARERGSSTPIMLEAKNRLRLEEARRFPPDE